MPRVAIIVLDSLGVGEMPDAGLYGDEGSNTLAHMALAVGGLDLPTLKSLGLGNIGDFKGISKTLTPLASHGKLAELSRGKDTVTGHWEMMGIVTETAFPTYPRGFPPEVIAEFEQRTGRKTLGNKAASGTEIIKELGDEHVSTGAPIVYTSADSVFQIAAHEHVIAPEELYALCRAAREMLVPPHNVCRVIARPFLGPPYERTPNRKDFSLAPPSATVLDRLHEAGLRVVSIGKVSDVFSGSGFSTNIRTKGNAESMQRLLQGFEEMREGLVFCTLTDFDMLWGHRNDPVGYANALEEFDQWLCGFLPHFGEGDYLIITADHGCDPTTPSTDHSREYVPLLLYGKGVTPVDLGLLEGFWHIGATVAEIFGVQKVGRGQSLGINPKLRPKPLIKT